MGYIFESERLGFRRFRDGDLEGFARMNGDDEVMRYFPNKLDRDGSDAFVKRIDEHFDEYGYGLYAVEVKESSEFIGFIGFLNADFDASFTPCVEIGWRLDKRFWNRGYATEGAKRCLAFGFDELGLDEVYSFTSVINEPSENVMRKIGLVKKGEFRHCRISDDSPLKPHVLYYIDRLHFRLIEIAGKLNDAGVKWGIGASLLLEYKGLVDVVHDIDIVTSVEDFDRVSEVLGTIGTEAVIPDKKEYKTSRFAKFDMKGVDLDLMAGFKVEHDGGVYCFPFDAESKTEERLVDGVVLHYTDIVDWLDAYRFMKNRDVKIKLIEKYLKDIG